ncbi:MAG: hypothetical protein WA902_07330 [Thermosynechococcaceae cyanobacterium]
MNNQFSFKMVLRWIKSSLSFIAEAAFELFSPDHDNYPNIGLQPFGGDPYNPRRHAM